MKKFALILLPFACGLLACGEPAQSSGDGSPSASSTNVVKKIFTITFETNGGSAVAPIQVEEGQVPTRPDDPTKEDYFFQGWFLDEYGVSQYYFEDPITSDLTLYAIWSQAPVVSSSSTADPVEIAYTVIGMPTWITNDDCVIFAWVWGDNDPGSWKSLEYLSDTSATFTVLGEINGFLLARCVAGTTKPDWSDTASNDPGRVYNKTADIECTSGLYTYTCSSWVGFPEN